MEELRKHLEDCFRRKQLMLFSHIITPAADVQQYFPDLQITIYSDYDLPELYDDMIGCDGCNQWYHICCVGVESPTLSQKRFHIKVFSKMTNSQ